MNIASMPSLFLMLSMTACSAGFDKDGTDPDDTPEASSEPESTPTDTSEPTDTAVDEMDPDDVDRAQMTTTCSGGGMVEGNGVSGSICISPADVASPQTTSQSETYTWHVGPTRAVSP